MSRNTTNDVKKFSIFSLKKWGKLIPENFSYGDNIIWSIDKEEVGRIGYSVSTISENSYIELDYKTREYEGEWKEIKYKIPLVRVPCNYGGYRWYFECSLYRNHTYCGRRVAVLYQVGSYFGCRHCADLSYDSCNENKRFRGWPWKVLTDSWKADELYAEIKRTHYRGKPTKKYRRYLKLIGDESVVYEAEKEMLKEL